MAKEINVQETIQSDFSVVVNDIAEELLTRPLLSSERINGRKQLSFMHNLRLLSALVA